MTFGIDIGTTAVAGVAVDGLVVRASVTRAHGADVAGMGHGVSEQDPQRILAAVRDVLAELEDRAGRAERIGWTGQMHGVVAVDESLDPLTNFVTWRDARRYGGSVMAGWRAQGLKPYKCLPVCGYAIARLFGRCVIDETFLESWHLECASGVPESWLPERVDGSMLGDNQAGVLAAQRILPGSAVINLGTSGQLSRVIDGGERVVTGSGVENRAFVGGKRLLCRASLVGGKAFADLRLRRDLSWEEMNARAETDDEIRACIERIVDDLFLGIDLVGVSGVVGVGNALTRNPAIRVAVERRLGLPCRVPEIAEMAAYGAALNEERKDNGLWTDESS